jgi:mannan endo-1,4-beta-mannosidase
MRRVAVFVAGVGAVLLVALVVVALQDMDPAAGPEPTGAAPDGPEAADAGDVPGPDAASDPDQEPDTDRDTDDEPEVAVGPPPILEVGVAVANLGALDDWIDTVGVTPDVLDRYESWELDRDLDTDLVEELARRGMTLKVTWEPWVAEGGVDQPQYSLASIIDGEHDDYLGRWAEQIGAVEQPVILRLMHEMNGDWYPWGAGVNGNAEGEYVAAWRHVRSVFDEHGVTNVEWEWAPNQLYDGTAALEPLYPGDDHVDRIGISAYNWGDEFEAFHRWREFPELMDDTVERIRTFAAAPIGVAETASSSVGGDKGAWIETMFQYALDEEYAFLTYFNIDTHRDWSIEPAYVEAFVDGFQETRAPQADASAR